MAIEDGKTMEFTEEMFQALVASREKTFAEMMETIPSQGYTIYDIREEDGFTAHLALKSPVKEGRGAVIVCPGGGFRFKSWNEALPVAEFFYQEGMNAAILDYHVMTEGPMAPNPEIQKKAGKDGIEAVRFLRTNAEKLGIDPEHIAIGGFSAGGMLSGHVATQYDCGEKDPQGVSSRPDAALILYGAFSATSTIPGGPGGMTREQIAEECSVDNVRNIHPGCPPMFVFQTHGDDPRIALNFCFELAMNGVPYEIHTFEDGPHGGGLYNGRDETPDEPHTALWSTLAADWLKHRGF